MTIEELLNYVQRTNPDMTKEKLVEELGKSNYSARGLIYTASCQNSLPIQNEICTPLCFDFFIWKNGKNFF